MKTAKAILSRQPKPVFSCPKYLIEKIPLNYKISITYKPKLKILERELFTDVTCGLKYAKEVAEYWVNIYFQRGIRFYKQRKS